METQLATAAAGYGPIVVQGATGHATDQPAAAQLAAPPGSIRRDSSRRGWVPLAAGLGLVLALAVVALALDSSVFGQSPKPRPAPRLTAPVAVLNAGDVPDAAHHLALNLAHRHVHVVALGNLGAPPPASYEILYVSGDAAQARLLAHVLKAQHPRVEPIDAGTGKAIGSTPKLVVVIP